MLTVSDVKVMENQKETLHYFSNMSTIRDHCTKEQLSEFVQIFNKTGASDQIMRNLEIAKENKCPRQKKFN